MKYRVLSAVAIILVFGISKGSGKASTELSPKIDTPFTTSTDLVNLGTTERVSLDSNGVEGNGDSTMPSISGDGRLVAFGSEADNLVVGDTNDTRDVYVHDLEIGQTIRVSVDSEGSQGNKGSGNYGTDISSNGRYVAFESHASNLVQNDINDHGDIFVHDLESSQTMLVSKATNGTQGNGDSYKPSISADGRYIAFNSNASNLIVDDTNDKMDVYVHDLLTGETSRVSVAGDGTQGNNHSQDPSISADGRYVAFSSTASNFVSSEPFFSSIFIHNLETGQTSSVSVNSEGTAANSYSFGPSISGNGRFISFTSAADNLVSGDINESDDIFVHDFQSGQTFLVSVASDGTQGNNDSAGTSVSGDGRYIAFGSRADNLTLVDTKSKWNIFLYDRQLQQTELISISSTGVIGNRGGALPNISADGNRIVYYSDSDNLVCGDNNSSRDIFLYDRLGILELHSISGTVTTREMKPIPNVRLSNGEGDEVLTDGNGNYKFEQLLPCSYQITPSLDEYNFSPVSRDITVPPSIENKYFTGNRRVYSFLPSITSNYCGSSYEEDFNNPNSGWPIGEDNYAAFDYLNGEYRIVAKQANMWAAARKISKSENLRTGVEVRTVNSIYGTYGLMFNLGEDWSHFYSFEIDPDGYYGIFRYSDAKGWKLLLVDYSPHIKTESAVNKLGVKRNGALIEVYANDHLLATIKDDSFIGKHYVGLIVTSYDQGYLDVRYDNFFIIPSECGGTTTLSMPGTTRLSTTSSKFFIQEGSKELH